MATNNDLEKELKNQSGKIDELVSAVNGLVAIAAQQMETLPTEADDGAPENSLLAQVAEVAKTSAKDALREAREDLAFYEKPAFKIAVGVTAVGIGGYFLHKAVKQSGVAHATSQRNSATIGLLGLEPDGDGGIIATGLSGIGKK